jgi:hypothetical protein
MSERMELEVGALTIRISIPLRRGATGS